MKDEILAKAYPEDPTSIPRYKIVGKDGSIVLDGVEIQLINEIIQAGTALNTENLLTDTTAKLFGLDATSVPDKVLANAGTRLQAVETLANSKCSVQFGNYAGNNAATKTLTFSAPPVFLAVTSNEYNLIQTPLPSSSSGGGWVTEAFIWWRGVTDVRTTMSKWARASVSGNSLTWKVKDNNSMPANQSKLKYYWFAILEG